MPMDPQVFLAIQSLTGYEPLDTLMMLAAEYLIVLVPLAFLVLWFRGRKGKRDALYLSASVLASLLLSYMAGLFYGHHPPSAVYDTIAVYHSENAFPSQHTTVLFAAVWPLFWRRRRYIATTLLVAAAATGFGRVYIGEHWPVDVVGGIVVSLAGYALLYLGRGRLALVFSHIESVGMRVEDRVRSMLE